MNNSILCKRFTLSGSGMKSIDLTTWLVSSYFYSTVITLTLLQNTKIFYRLGDILICKILGISDICNQPKDSFYLIYCSPEKDRKCVPYPGWGLCLIIKSLIKDQ